MPWARFDDRFPSNRKIAMLSDRAFRLYVTAVCWSAENLTDGEIQRDELRLISTYRNVYRSVDELTERDLWVTTEHGWRIHDYHDYNPTREQVLAERAKNAARQAAFRRRKNGSPLPPDGADTDPRNARSNGVTNGGRNGVSNGAPSRPDPSSVGTERENSDGSSERAHEPPLSLIPPGWTPDEEHLAAARPDLDRLGPAAAAAATAKFVRHHTAHATRVADFGPLWLSWLARERPDPPTQGAFLVPLPGGADTPAAARRRAAREDLDRIADELRAMNGGST